MPRSLGRAFAWTLPLLVLLVFGQVSPALAASACPQFFAGGQAPVAAVPTEPLCYTSYAVAYAPGWGEPAYAAEHLTADQARAGEATARIGNFHVELRLPAAERITPADYDRSGFDRGHQVPAGDVGPDKPETFAMSNMSPQTPALNRISWAGVEAAVRALAIADGELYVVTGPQIDPVHHLMNAKVAIPSASWKAVDDPNAGGAAAYLCTNTDAPVCEVISIAALAVDIGFDPFPALPAEVKAVAITLPEPTKGGQLSN
jgi:endonuclease G